MFFTALESLSTGSVIFLLVSLAIALSFEFVNGFHDTANAVATVIYTKALRARTAVILSGVCNFIGVHLGGIAVAYAIVHLLPVDILVRVDTLNGLAMVFALLVSAIVWNFGTWRLGLPASSSHTLIGSIIGVGLANCLAEGVPPAIGVNWSAAAEVGLSLFLSPVVGFALAFLLLRLSSRVFQSPVLHSEPRGDAPPPWGVRALLVFSGAGVSLSHGSNDGQKGVGLIMLILIGILPAQYALDPDMSQKDIAATRQAASELAGFLNAHDGDILQSIAAGAIELPRLRTSAHPYKCGLANAIAAQAEINQQLAGIRSFAELPPSLRYAVRNDILCLDDAVRQISLDLESLNLEQLEMIDDWRKQLRQPTEYAPDWVLLAVSVALGLGTMVGWRRIVVTIGEKIGKTRMTYAQGATAQLVAMGAICLADGLGMPVSTTHVLSSGVAGTMAASRSGLQFSTLRSILLAWVLTLPAAVALSAALFWLFTWLM